MTKFLEASRRGGVVPALVLGVVVSLATIGLSSIGVFEGWQTRAVDAFQFLRDREPPAEIALVQIDEDAFRELGERRPLPQRFLADLTEAMNEYLTAMVDRILNRRGMVSDFIGDGIMAFFGAPLDDPDHAWHAVQAAVEMQAALEALNAR